MMAFREVNTLLIGSIWIIFFRFTLGDSEIKARIRVKYAFSTFKTPSGHIIDKLIHDAHSLYAGGPQGLYMLNPEGNPVLKQVHVPIFASECQSSPTDCEYEITLLKEGRDGNPLFMCGTRTGTTNCCDVTSDHLPVNCFRMKYTTTFNEPSLHVGDSLYYTISTGNKHQSLPSGIYGGNVDRYIWPISKKIEQKYVKILANHSQGSLDGKLYFFYIEQNQNQDPEMPLWTPRVSQICRADRGGSKAVLQNRWTSLLTARLFCGDEKKHLSYTELLDVIVLEDTEWKDTTIYTLFKNEYNLTAVCVYNMSHIIGVFTSNELKSDMVTTSSLRPGECVEDSRGLPPDFLKFMESQPELRQWIKPAQDPLLFSHHYTHLQVHRVNSEKSGNNHNVLFMSLDNGNIHKILEQDGASFIIAEYEPFKSRTSISGMLLDTVTKKLFVISASEVIQINLYNCSVYGNNCDSCVMARDPYCGWNQTVCTANHGCPENQ